MLDVAEGALPTGRRDALAGAARRGGRRAGTT
jgi:hypothetical protein